MHLETRGKLSGMLFLLFFGVFPGDFLVAPFFKPHRGRLKMRPTPAAGDIDSRHLAAGICNFPDGFALQNRDAPLLFQ